MTLEKVDALIARVEAKHPRLGRAATATYYEAVHQELAPLARALERRIADLEAERADAIAQAQASWRTAAEERSKPKTRAIYMCTSCPNVYRAGDQNVTVYGLNARVWCRKCTPFDTWHRTATPMTESREPCPKNR